MMRTPLFGPIAATLLPALVIGSTVCMAEPLPRFPDDAVWNQNIESAALHPDSETMIATVSNLGGFGRARMQIDFSLQLVRAAASGVATRDIVAIADGYYSPDCEDLATAAMPVPDDAAIEGETGLTCDNDAADCHLLVLQGNTLFEAYRVNQRSPSVLEAQCLAVWNLGVVYPPEGRGEHCTSADAAGFPMAPLLFNADEIGLALAADASGGGDVGHVIRFTLPNERIATDAALGGFNGRLYVRPATHAGGPRGPATAVPYGARLRLRSDFPLTGYPPAARVILNTMKRFGMVLADGGTVALTAESDRYTTTKWTELGIDSRIFDQTPGATTVLFDDFDVIDTGPRIGETYDCVRTDIPIGSVPPAPRNFTVR